MYTPLLKLLPGLRITTPVGPNLDHAQIAIDACIAAVQTYFPCDSITPTNHTCLCEQYTWRISCYDNHASTLSTQPDHVSTIRSMRENCFAAGDTGLAMVQHKYHQERRQINSLLNSVGGVVQSFLSSQSVVAIPSAIPSIPSINIPSIAPLASPTSQANADTATARSSAPTPTTLMPAASTASDASQASAQSPTSSAAASAPSKSSSPSTGVIVGAVVGGVAVLLLLGILIMLILRHKRKKRQAAQPTYQSTVGTASARSLDETLVDRTPMIEHRGPGAAGAMMGRGPEKEVYQSHQQDVPMPRQSELYTNANVWELDGRETAVPTELESPAISRVGSPLVSPLVEDGRDRGSGFDFGFEQRRTGPRRGDELHF